MKPFKLLLAAIALANVFTASARAAAVVNVNGFVLGPDDGTSITLKFTNEANSTLDIKSIRLDGNTAAAFPLIWDGVGPVERARHVRAAHLPRTRTRGC